MERLTGRNKNGDLLVNGNMVYAGELYEVASALEEHEDMEEQLEKVYGECEGLLETAIKHISDIEKYGVDIGNPLKSRLLTDDDADKWEKWKNAEEQGKLLILPCKPGDAVYVISNYSNYRKSDREIIKAVVTTVRLKNDGTTIGFSCRGKWKNQNPYIGNFTSNSVGKTVFLTEQEANESLEGMKE